MGWIPTVEMFKDGRRIRVNADTTLQYAREGWSRENPNEPKGSKRELTPDEITAEKIIMEQLLKDKPEQPEPKPEPEKPALNLDDLQA